MESYSKRAISVALLIMSLWSLSVTELLFAAPGDSDQISPVNQNLPVSVPDPGSDLWRAVRQRNNQELVPATTQMKKINSGVLINTNGEKWREIRKRWLVPYGGYFLMGVTAFLALLWLLVKKSPVPNGRSGKVVTRMSTMQRVTHWFFAGLIGFMAITGLILLFGRTVIIPLLGLEGFSPLASASKEGHNLVGPLLIVSVLLMLAYFIRYNWPEKGDLKWLLTLGGKFSKEHPKTGFFNAGEKILYWSTVLLGIVLCVSGLLLLFPYYQETVNRAQLALIIHAIAALIIIAMAFAHIWMVRTVDGTIDAMTSGDVDINWAKEHHSRWYQEKTGSKAEKAEDSQHEEPINAQQNAAPSAEQKGAY